MELQPLTVCSGITVYRAILVLHKWTHTTLTPGQYLTYLPRSPGGMEGWVDVGGCLKA